MKAITKLFLTTAVLSGTVSFQMSRNGDALMIETTVSNPEVLIETAGAVISAAGDVLHSFENTAASQPEANEPNGEPVIYRVRNTAGDAASQIGAYYDLNLAKQVCPAGYCIFDMQNRPVYIAGQHAG